MSKSSAFSNPAFQNRTPQGFNHINETTPFNSVFDIKPLEGMEATRIEKLLVDNFQPGKITEEQVSIDVDHLKSITADIKGIGRQGAVLIGERVYKARELLKPYKDGTFTKWLEETFGTRRTGYNMLSYFELYQKLPELELKENFKKIPQGAAYILASRSGSIEKKVEIIRNSNKLDHEDLINRINETFPVSSGDKRKRVNDNSKFIEVMRTALKNLASRKGSLTEQNKIELLGFKGIIDSIINSNGVL